MKNRGCMSAGTIGIALLVIAAVLFFWGKNGYGGGSVIPNSKPKNIGQQTLVLNVGITF